MKRSSHWHEYLIEETNVPLSDYNLWIDSELEKPCSILQILGHIVVTKTEELDEMEPHVDNIIFIRCPIGI
jgi:hypothetical protein